MNARFRRQVETTPDFSKPAFTFVALGNARFRTRDEGGHAGPFRSDLRCQSRSRDAGGRADADVRVYFVGQDVAQEGDEIPILLAFLDWERACEECRVGSTIELCEGNAVLATAAIHAIATR